MLDVEAVSVCYDSVGGRRTQAVADAQVSVGRGEFVSLIGPSGCGKSTLLHCMGGLLTPTTGSISVEGKPVRGADPRQSSFVFQDYSLFPWKTVLDNAAIGLRFAGMPKAKRRAAAREQLRLMGLGDRADSYPSELSGGMQQRVAVARALAMDPKILLMDEPFGALDEQSRRRIGVEMSAVLGEVGKTVVMVTHSLDEAIFWADRVMVMSRSPGRIRAVIEIDEPRPRGLEFTTDPRFAALRSELFGMLDGLEIETRTDPGREPGVSDTSSFVSGPARGRS